MQFEILKTDLAARIGSMRTEHGTVSTPAYVPVIHPAKQSIPAKYIMDMGFDIVITNAYITRNTYGDEAIKRGIHDIISYDGAIMTDSGGYQVLEYGKVDVSPHEMAAFERGIRTDFAIPLDRPTGFGMPYNAAESYVRHTLKVSKETLAEAKRQDGNGQTWIGPIQGGEHSKLVARSTKSLVKMGYEMLALGSPVEFMEAYEYAMLAEMITTAKRNMPHGVPLHLFGAGHPLTIALAVALGCDTFDSASYILYAKQRRYMTEDGTRSLDDLEYLPCCCPVCVKYTPAELRKCGYDEVTKNLGIHNLFAIKLELDKTRQAVAEGRLWEHVMKKARAHPKLYEAITAAMTSQDNAVMFKTGTPQFKPKAVFLFGIEDQHRPEVAAYHDMVRRFTTKKKIVQMMPNARIKPGYMSHEYKDAYRRTKKNDDVQFCQYDPILGLMPIELSDVYPAAHHESVRNADWDPILCTEFAKTWHVFFANNVFAEVRYDKGDRFLEYFAKQLKGTRRRSLKGAS